MGCSRPSPTCGATLRSLLWETMPSSVREASLSVRRCSTPPRKQPAPLSVAASLGASKCCRTRSATSKPPAISTWSATPARSPRPLATDSKSSTRPTHPNTTNSNTARRAFEPGAEDDDDDDAQPRPTQRGDEPMKFNPSEPRPYYRRGVRQLGRWEIDLRGVLDNGLKVDRQRRVFPLNPAAGKIGKRQAA